MKTLLKGTEVREKILKQLKNEVKRAKEQTGKSPCLKVILVGDDPASEVYVRNKALACEKTGFQSGVLHLKSSTSQEMLLKHIYEFNQDPDVNGILVQLPLPGQINEESVIQAINPIKDVDGFHPQNVGLLCIGRPAFIPCTALGIVEIFKHYQIQTEGKRVVINGRSNLVGKPLMNLLVQKGPYANATVTICHSRTQNLGEICQQADILIAAIGKARFVNSQMVKKNAVVIDVGINRISDPSREKGYRLVGDVDFDAVEKKVEAITPVPGGVGPMTIASLMLNTWEAFQRQNNFI